jgi:Protein of unknown function (DUF2934)
MDDREEKIRVRAYEIWERQERSGSPEDHWLEAERELKAEEGKQGAPQDAFEATVEQRLPSRLLTLTPTALRKANILPGRRKAECRFAPWSP